MKELAMKEVKSGTKGEKRLGERFDDRKRTGMAGVFFLVWKAVCSREKQQHSTKQAL